jgi:hypothetical protein
MTNPKPSKITAQAKRRMRKTPAAKQLAQARYKLSQEVCLERVEPVQKGMLQ